MAYALQYEGDGEFKAANAYHARACDKALVVGEVQTWEIIQERSHKTHAHYFACIHDAWLNLPEQVAGEFPSSESLRKWALIKAGYCTVNKIVCSNNREAIGMVALIYEVDKFIVCEVSGKVATIYRAQSQSCRAMGKALFQKSKSDVLEVLSDMIGAEIKEMAA